MKGGLNLRELAISFLEEEDTRAGVMYFTVARRSE